MQVTTVSHNFVRRCGRRSCNQDFHCNVLAAEIKSTGPFIQLGESDLISVVDTHLCCVCHKGVEMIHENALVEHVSEGYVGNRTS